ncbi:MAG TPA: arginine deiminase-related protein [Acidimicrobiales bacterium]|nr:arginine deiminase-related protein [Acidimicrobiales bacterium]
MSELAWGRRFLMCPPDHFDVAYEINPWMSVEVQADPERAAAQWENLVSCLRQAGAAVEVMDPVEGLPDLVFTANAGIVNGSQFVPSRFRHPERQGETPHDVRWFSCHGFRVEELPNSVTHEGAGDALPFGSVLLSGYRFRSDAASHAHLSRLTGAAVRSLELSDPRLYHLDLVFCPLDDRRALVAPLGLDRYGRKVVEATVPEPLLLDDDQALSFCANSVVVGTNMVMPACPPALGRRLEKLGFEVAVCPVDEFQKAGGGCRCLTLALDVSLAVAA